MTEGGLAADPNHVNKQRDGAGWERPRSPIPPWIMVAAGGWAKRSAAAMGPAGRSVSWAA